MDIEPCSPRIGSGCGIGGATVPIVFQEPTETGFVDDPYRFYAERHAKGARFFWSEYGFVCFAGFDDVNALLRDRRFGRRPGLPTRTAANNNWYETERYSLLALDPPDHTALRGLVNRAFLSRHIESLRPRIQELAMELLDAIRRHGQSTELLTCYAAPLPAIVIAELIGLPRSQAPQLVAWSNDMVQMYKFGVDDAVVDAADKAAEEFVDYLRSVIAVRRREPTDDLLSHMLTVEVDGGRLSDAEVIATTILLLNAGHEATVHTTGNAVRAILNSGLDPSTLFLTDESTAATVEECLRIDAPLHMFTRFALEDVNFGGIEFARGDQIGLLLGAANHDPRRFVDPSAFDPSRADRGNVSFGAGIHFCIGAPLARLELQISLPLLFEKCAPVRVVGEMHYRNVFHFHGLERLDIEVPTEHADAW